MGEATDALKGGFGFAAKEVNYLLLSHVYIDHCGLIAKLVKEGFAGTIYCTAATRDLALLLLQDSADIQRNESNLHNTHHTENDDAVEPLYTLEDVEKTAQLFTIVELDNG